MGFWASKCCRVACCKGITKESLQFGPRNSRRKNTSCHNPSAQNFRVAAQEVLRTIGAIQPPGTRGSQLALATSRRGLSTSRGCVSVKFGPARLRESHVQHKGARRCNSALAQLLWKLSFPQVSFHCKQKHKQA